MLGCYPRFAKPGRQRRIGVAAFIQGACNGDLGPVNSNNQVVSSRLQAREHRFRQTHLSSGRAHIEAQAVAHLLEGFGVKARDKDRTGPQITVIDHVWTSSSNRRGV